jgi:RNA polymerase sigma-70 factor (ECF subfamily)
LIHKAAEAENRILNHQVLVEAEVLLLYEEHAPALTRYAAGFAHSDDLARDAVQETFLRYFVERTYGRVIEYPRAWLYQVTRHYLLDRMSAASASREVGAEGIEKITDPTSGPERMVERSQMAQEIDALLSPRERECLGLRSEGFSYIEIAGVMGLATGTVGALLARAHTKIRHARGVAGTEALDVAGALHHLFHGVNYCRQ